MINWIQEKYVVLAAYKVICCFSLFYVIAEHPGLRDGHVFRLESLKCTLYILISRLISNENSHYAAQDESVERVEWEGKKC